MSDFITELRREVVGAHATHYRRSPRASRMRRWRPALTGAVALAALVVALVIVVRSIPQSEPSGEPRVVKVLRLGGIPVDGVLAAGALWVTDSTRAQVVRIDLRTRRVAARIRLTGNVDEIAAGDGGLWVRTYGMHGDDTRLSRIDPHSNRVVAGFVAAPGSPLAVGGGAIWADRRLVPPEGIERIDAARGTVTRRVAFRDIDGIAVANGVVWAIAHNGTVARIDAASGRIERRWSQLAASDATADSSKAIVADAAGAWVLSTEQAAIFRLEAERVTRKLEIDSSAQPILAATAGGLWIAAGDALRGQHRVVRIDPASGEETASVDVGAARPRALLPVAGGLWVVRGDGTAVLIDT